MDFTLNPLKSVAHNLHTRQAVYTLAGVNSKMVLVDSGRQGKTSGLFFLRLSATCTTFACQAAGRESRQQNIHETSWK